MGYYSSYKFVEIKEGKKEFKISTEVKFWLSQHTDSNFNGLVELIENDGKDETKWHGYEEVFREISKAFSDRCFAIYRFGETKLDLEKIFFFFF